MKDKILQKLHSLEQQYNITILLTVDGGSYEYGYASPDSDHDVRFIYVNLPDYYFAITPKADNIEVKDDGCGLDFVGYDLRKALGFILKGNALTAEWTHSEVYFIDRDGAKAQLRTMAHRKIVRTLHFVTLAKDGSQKRLWLLLFSASCVILTVLRNV